MINALALLLGKLQGLDRRDPLRGIVGVGGEQLFRHRVLQGRAEEAELELAVSSLLSVAVQGLIAMTPCFLFPGV